MTTAVRHLHSIQGEQLPRRVREAMDQDAVDEYVAAASEAVRACRQLGHVWPPVGRHGPNFVATGPGNSLVEQDDCERCGPLAYRERMWMPRREGSQTRWRPETVAQVKYRTGPNGECYQAPPGQGYMTRTQVAESAATQALRGRTVADVRRAALRRATDQ
jgi:hypothetical protein